jgi:hypothetical protein
MQYFTLKKLLTQKASKNVKKIIFDDVLIDIFFNIKVQF